MHLLPSTSRLLLPDQKRSVFHITPRRVLPAGRIGLGVNISSIIYFHLQSLKLLWSPPPAPASDGRGHKLTKRECKRINEWCGGTNESFMCCSSARLTLSNYLASAFNGGVSKWDKSALTREILKDLGVRDMLTEWVLTTLLRPPRSHTQLGTQAWCILSEDTHTGERFFFPSTNMQSMSSPDLQDGTVHINQPGRGCVKKHIEEVNNSLCCSRVVTADQYSGSIDTLGMRGYRTYGWTWNDRRSRAGVLEGTQTNTVEHTRGGSEGNRWFMFKHSSCCHSSLSSVICFERGSLQRGYFVSLRVFDGYLPIK